LPVDSELITPVGDLADALRIFGKWEDAKGG
jgi:hypothetical protein